MAKKHKASVPRTSYPVPGTSYPVPGTSYPVPGTQYPVPRTQYLVPSTYVPLFTILILTALSYIQMFDAKKEFTNWDDDAYVTNQPLVKSLEKENIKEMFKTKSRVAANYHPLTILSLAIDYKRGNGSMAPFVQTNLALHLVNTAMVFFFVMMLMRGNLLMSALAAGLFGIHPMHVESVAWIAERKDVLYTLFYLLACMSYLRYVRTGSWLWLAGSFALFIVSCYAKPMAITLPVLLIVLDVYERRGFSVRTLVEKVPFFAVAVIFGLFTLEVQSNTFQGLVDTNTYSLFERIGFASYGTVNYVIKLFVPTGLSAVYPYPTGNVVGKLAANVLVCLAAVGTGLAVLTWKTLRNAANQTLWTVFFGVMFFFVTISIVLQLISVGGAVMADRYTYVPYIGLFIALGAVIDRVTQAPSMRRIAIAVLVLIGLAYAGITYARVGVWRDSGTLWSDVIEKYPYEFDTSGRIRTRGINHAYNNRAVYYMEKGNNAASEADYKLLKKIGTTKPYTYKGYGALLQRQGRHAEAIVEFTTALRYGNQDPQILKARGFSYALSRDYSRAAADLRSIVAQYPQDIPSAMIFIEALLSIGNYQELLDATKNLSFPLKEQSSVHLARGVALGRMNKNAEAVTEFERALQLNPSNDNARSNLAIARRTSSK